MRQAKVAEKGAAPAVTAHPEWSQLLVDAVNKPGTLSKAYSRFWQFSTGNQLLALFQCMERGLEPGPIHTFGSWLALGRHVNKGQKAITLCMPVSVKRKREEEPFDPSLVRVGDGAERQLTGPGGIVPAADAPVKITVFTYKPHWFLLSQTDGEEYKPAELPEWSEDRALAGLNITRVRFHHPDGNCQGYASERTVAVSPISTLPHKTLFHEMAHVVLGHTAECPGLLDDHDFTPRSIREAEAESVALIVCESLNLIGAEFCRGYIQHWLAGNPIPDRSAQKIFKAADQILKAGHPAKAEQSP